MRVNKKFVVLFFTCFIVLFSYLYFHLFTPPVLMYHYIDEKEGSLYVAPQAFKTQMEYLRTKGYRPISIKEFKVYMSISRQNMPHNIILITFDDGFQDNYKNAFAILKEFGFKAVMFVPPKKVGTEGRLTWEEIIEMDKSGLIDICSHSYDEEYLPSLSPQRIYLALKKSKEELEQHLGHEVDCIAYPSGGYNNIVREQARAAGFTIGFATHTAPDRFNRDPLGINRVKIKETDAEKLWKFRAKLSGFYNLFRKMK